MRNGIDTVTEWFVWNVGTRIQTIEITRDWAGPRTYVYKSNDEFVKIEVK